MRNRTLMRPMFRIGGSSGTGITSGLDRPGYRNGPGPNMLDVAGRSLPGNALTNKITPKVDKKPTGIGMGTIPGFITSLGLNLATQTPTGNIFSDIAGAAKDPFDTFQQAKFAEAKEEREFERERELQMLKNLDEDQRTAIKKRAQDGVDAGYYEDINEGIRRLLQTDEFGVADRPGERRTKLIDDLVRIEMGQPGRSGNEEPIVRNEVTVRQDYKTLEENNQNVDFAPPSLIALDIDEDGQGGYKIINTNLTPGKVYYSGFTDEFFLFNGPDAETKFTKVDIKR
jgi:hypothetical protein